MYDFVVVIAEIIRGVLRTGLFILITMMLVVIGVAVMGITEVI